jgi:hypothetical protein
LETVFEYMPQIKDTINNECGDGNRLRLIAEQADKGATQDSLRQQQKASR